MAGKGHACPCVLPERDGHQSGTANRLDKSCAMVCHKSRKFLFFAGRVLWMAPVSFGGEGQGRANLSYGGGKRAMAGSESGGKDGAEGGEPGLSRRERTAVVSADRQECRTGPRCRRCLPRWACTGRHHAGRRRSGRVCGSEATRSIGMSRAEGHVCF